MKRVWVKAQPRDFPCTAGEFAIPHAMMDLGRDEFNDHEMIVMILMMFYSLGENRMYAEVSLDAIQKKAGIPPELMDGVIQSCCEKGYIKIDPERSNGDIKHWMLGEILFSYEVSDD